MKRLVAAAAFGLVVGTAGLSNAATLRPVDQDGLNLRSGPGTGYAVVGGLATSQSAAVLGEKDGWFKVRTAAGAEGWVSGEFSNISYTDEQAYAIVNTDLLNVRAAPDTKSPAKTAIKQDEQVRLLVRSGNWWQVRLTGGTEGWVAAQYMKRVTAAPAPAPAPSPAAPVEPPVSKTPPPAPPAAVPVLPPLQPAPPVAVGTKQGLALAESRVYFGRNTKAFDVTGSVRPGEKLTFLDSAEGWWKVKTPRGEQGWIPGEAAIVTEQNLTYSITEGRWSLGYVGRSQAVPKPLRLQVQTAYALFLQETGELNLLFKGDPLELVQTQPPYMRVKTAAGVTGLVAAESVAPVASPEPPAVTEALVATLKVVKPGVFSFDLQARGKNLGVPVAQGDSLHIPLATGQTETRTLPVGDAGVRSITIGAAGLWLNMERLPAWQVAEQAPGRLSLELSSALTAVTVSSQPTRTIVDLKIGGQVEPKLSAAAGTIVMEIPGATAAPGLTVPSGVKVEKIAGGLKLSFSSRRAYAVKQTDTGLALHLYAPGLKDKVILIDPGHGGFDSGAINKAQGLQEAALNLENALRLRALLQAKGATVYMTRIADASVAPADLLRNLTGTDRTQADLGYRTRMANELKADLFLSIHHNSGDRLAGGTETYYTLTTLNGSRSADLSRLLQEDLVKALGRKNRGAKNELFYVTRNTNAPAALVEIAFLDHEWEAKLVKAPDFQHKAAQAMVQAIELFYRERSTN